MEPPDLRKLEFSTSNLEEEKSKSTWNRAHKVHVWDVERGIYLHSVDKRSVARDSHSPKTSRRKSRGANGAGRSLAKQITLRDDAALPGYMLHNITLKSPSAELFFNRDGTTITVSNPPQTTSWEIDRPRVEIEKALSYRSGDEGAPFLVFSSFRDGRLSEWCLSFVEKDGERRDVVIPIPEVRRTGPIAHCGDKVAIACENGRFLLLDVSRVITGINLPNVSYKSMPTSFGKRNLVLRPVWSVQTANRRFR